MAAISGNINTVRRQLKNVVGNYSTAQIKVREATSNDPWGPSSTLLSEISDLTYNPLSFAEIMQMLWKRLNDHGRNWRHVYKSLVVLDYLIKLGSEKVALQCRENIFAIQTLKDFQHIEENKDRGLSVREKAKQLVTLLKDEERLKSERLKAMAAKRRFIQQGMGISYDGKTNRMKNSKTFSGEPEFDQCRPHSVGEEELQLQIALALSREEAQKEEEARKHDNIRFHMALNQSTTQQQQPQASTSSSEPNNASKINFKTSSQSTSFQNDPWSDLVCGSGGGGKAFHSQPTNDPWGDSAQIPSSSFSLRTNNDPWGSHFPPAAPQDDVVQSCFDNQLDEFDPLKTGNKMSTASATHASTSMTTTGTRKIRSPAEFLGENSALVNLDNLLGESKTQDSTTAHNKQQTNPFLTGPSSSVMPNTYSRGAPYYNNRPSSTNPFL